MALPYISVEDCFPVIRQTILDTYKVDSFLMHYPYSDLERLDMGQSAVSYHMKILCQSGIVLSRQEGKWTYYWLSPTGGKEAAALLLQLTTPNTQNAD